MDSLSPIVGTVTGIKIAQWKIILVFGFKVILFSVPFILIGLLVEKDIIRVPVLNRVAKSLLAFIFLLPLFLIGILNYLAPGLSDAFWESYPLLEGFWIMEGSLAPAILSGMVLLYLLLYVMETARGDMSS